MNYETTAIGYIRVSTDDQHLGPVAQRAAIEAWTKRHGVTVAAWCEDLGVSGGSDLDTRPGLAAALEAVRTHRAGVLVVAKRDRLARDVFLALSIERTAAKAGARIVTADGVANGQEPADALMRHVLDAVGQFERSLIRQRTKSALAAKSARGERVGGIPLGKRLAADGKALEADPVETALLAQVRELRASGMSVRTVADALSLAGIRHPRTGRTIGKSQFARMGV